jgi:hypothetical protein
VAGGRIIDRILQATPEERFAIYASMTPEELYSINLMLDAEIDNPWALYEDDPVGFVTKGLGESLWSRQREIMESLKVNKRTVVPACHAPGKSHLAARAVAWWISVHPPGTAIAVTTATTHRQVRNILWPHIRRLAANHDLPGEVLTVQWKIDNTVVSYGFSPAAHDETAVQGIHAPHLLVVVDEAGGVGDLIGGALEALMTGGHTRLLVLGNPPTDAEDTWFERICSSDLYNVIPISAYDTPNFTGEETDWCRSCPPHVEPHRVAYHLVDQTWVEDVVNEFGDDSPFVEARVHAKFPRATANKVIPFTWCEKAAENDDPTESNLIRLGIDIASDGGDEFVIAKSDGFTAEITHRSSGQVNQNAVDVAAVALSHINAACDEQAKRPGNKRVRVKIDVLGVGWGVVSLLQRWGEEGKHAAEIVAVNVAERAIDGEKFMNKRAEMWWNGRTLLQPRKDADGMERIEARINVDRKVMAQLSAPTFGSDGAGRVQIEKKTAMKRRGVSSPDRAEAILLAWYEPEGAEPPVVAPIGLSSGSAWGSIF